MPRRQHPLGELCLPVERPDRSTAIPPLPCPIPIECPYDTAVYVPLDSARAASTASALDSCPEDGCTDPEEPADEDPVPQGDLAAREMNPETLRKFTQADVDARETPSNEGYA
jgi:hypothetical protein